MTTKTWPSQFKTETVDYGIEFDVQITTMRNGRLYTYGLPGARWTATLTFPDDLETGIRPALEAFLASLKGGVNRLQMGHLGRKVPNGTMRGSPTLNGGHAAGTEQLSLTNVNGTLKEGDIIGLPGQMLMVTAGSAPVTGNMVIQVTPPLFSGFAGGTPVTWSQPTTLWIPRSSTLGPFPYRAAQYRPGFSMDFVESVV
jgi:hypothetical protein